MSHLELLQTMPIFGGIRQDTLEFLLGLAPIVSVANGKYFFREDDRAVSMFVLQAGRVKMIKTHNGGEHLLGFLDKGDCFGEMALIDLFPRSVSVRAVADCQAIEISSATLYEIYTRDLEQFTLIHMNLARELSRRLRKADERLFETAKAVSLGEKAPFSI